MAATVLTTLMLAAGGSLPLAAPNAVTELVALAGPGAARQAAETSAHSLNASGFTIAWTVLTTLLLVALTVATVLQRRCLSGGVSSSIEGVRVLVTERFGPAVTSVLRPVIVIPAWLLELPPSQRHLVIRHEADHAASGDHRLSAASLVLCCVFAWNPFLWYQLHRLRLAIEIDCDARVLRRKASARAEYDMLLIDVAE